MYRREIVKAVAAALMVSAVPSAFAFTAGQDYIVLDKPLANAEGTIIKIWSYDCPFCYKYDSAVDPKAVPKITSETNLNFVPYHLETKGKFGRAASEYLALCQIRDRDAKGHPKYDLAKKAWYTAYHKKGERWAAGEDAFIKTAADATGISVEDFKAHRADADVKALADSWKASYDIAKLQGVPAYVVNGKYLLMTKAIRSIDGMVNLVKELSAK